MIILFNIIAIYGITNIIVNGKIFEGIKSRIKNETLLYILNCFLCCSFHLGWLIGLLYDVPYDKWNIIFNGGFYSGTTWVINSIVMFLGNGGTPIFVYSKLKEEE